VADEQQTSGVLVISSKALGRNADSMFALVRETLDSARFDELQRLRELLSQMRARRDQSITGSGHSLAMAAASSRMSPSALLGHTLSGLEGIRRTRALEKSLQSDAELAAFAARLLGLQVLRAACCWSPTPTTPRPRFRPCRPVGATRRPRLQPGRSHSTRYAPACARSGRPARR
jgi:Zn-dependent M16 (insulinase) family peptidase